MTDLSFKIIPERIDAPFKEVWEELSQVQELYVPYIPIREMPHLSALGAERTADDTCLLYSCDRVYEIIDRLGWRNESQQLMGAVLTHQRLVPNDMVAISMPSSQLIERYFHSPRTLSGIIWNSNSNKQLRQVPCVTDLVASARILGMLSSCDPWASSAPHVSLVDRYVEMDNPYAVLHHAVLARDEGAPVDSFYFGEIGALITLGLYNQVGQYYQWYPGRGGDSDRFEILSARIETLNSKPDSALRRLDKLGSIPRYFHLIALERGRALFSLNDHDGAIAAYSEAVDHPETKITATLGRGIATRAKFYNAQDGEQGLSQALHDFETVCSQKSYAEAESLHHCGTVLFPLNRVDEAIERYEAAIALRYSAVSYRNLFLALHLKGDLEEAKRAHQILSDLSPQAAQGLEKYLAEQPKSQSDKGCLDSPSKALHEPLKSVEECSKNSLEAFQQLKQADFGFTGDLADFLRMDDYIDYHAPQGKFLPSSMLHKLSEEEFQELIHRIGSHLAGVLVRRKYARWDIQAPNGELGAVVRFLRSKEFRESICIHSQLQRRIAQGAIADNLTLLETLVSHLPDFDKQRRQYKRTVDSRPLEEQDLNSLNRRIDATVELLAHYGYSLDRSYTDLVTLDTILRTELTMEGGSLRFSNKLTANTDLDAVTFVEDIGLLLGSIYLHHTRGSWRAHPEVAGMMVESTILNPLAPVALTTRYFTDSSGDVSFDQKYRSSLVLAELAYQKKNGSLNSLEEICEALEKELPNLAKDDPSGQATRRMAQSVVRFSATA